MSASISFSSQSNLISQRQYQHTISMSASNSNTQQSANSVAVRRKGGYLLRENPRKSSRINNIEFVDLELIAWDDNEVIAACHLMQLRQGQERGQMETSDDKPSAMKIDGGSSSSVTLEQEEKTRKDFVCAECSKQFPSHWALAGHISGHRRAVASISRSRHPTPEELDAPALPSSKKTN